LRRSIRGALLVVDEGLGLDVARFGSISFAGMSKTTLMVANYNTTRGSFFRWGMRQTRNERLF